jgi:hypothetical protein
MGSIDRGDNNVAGSSAHAATYTRAADGWAAHTAGGAAPTPAT